MKKDIWNITLGALTGAVVTKKINELLSKPSQETEEKLLEYYHILNSWLEIKQDGRSLSDYFKKSNYKKIGIYGMGDLGKRLYYELKEADMKLCLIDKNADEISFEEEVISLEDVMPALDVVVVCSSYYFDGISKKLKRKVKCPIISIRDVVRAVLYA